MTDDRNEFKALRASYSEWCNCGNKGTFIEYLLKVGYNPDKETQVKK